MLPFGVEFEFEVPGRWIDRDRRDLMGGAGFVYSVRAEKDVPPEAESLAVAFDGSRYYVADVEPDGAGGYRCPLRKAP